MVFSSGEKQWGAAAHKGSFYGGRKLLSAGAARPPYASNDALAHAGPGIKILFFCVICLFLGAVTVALQTKLKTPVPFTVYLFAIGLLLQWIFHDATATFMGSSMDVVKGINAHLLLHLFIPPLALESSMNMNFHLFQQLFGHSLLLGSVGVMIQALIMAGLTMLWSYDWNFATAFMFGAIVSATDPIAVVALLKELGAPESLGTLIEGESLLNDGVAFVLYVIIKKFVMLNGDNATDIFLQFVQLTLVGPLFGIAMGMMVKLWLFFCYEDFLQETGITIMSAYATFVLGELYLQTSGILAVVFLGLTLSKYKENISPKVEHELHGVWEMMTFIANILIFIISGVLVGWQMFYAHATTIEKLTLDALLDCTCYVFVHIARGISVIMLTPLLRKMGDFTYETALVAWFGGLRGAIGLALALDFVFTPHSATLWGDKCPSQYGTDCNHPKLHENGRSNHWMEDKLGKGYSNSEKYWKKTQGEIIFHIAGIAMLTLTINGIFMKNLLAYLGLVEMTQTAAVLFWNTLQHISQSTDSKMDKWREDSWYKRCDWQSARIQLPEFTNLYDDKFKKDVEKWSKIAIAQKLQCKLRQELTGQVLDELFAEYDKDGNGQLDIQEIGEMMDELQLPLHPNEMMKHVDADSEGGIDIEEFKAWFAAFGPECTMDGVGAEDDGEEEQKQTTKKEENLMAPPKLRLLNTEVMARDGGSNKSPRKSLARSEGPKISSTELRAKYDEDGSGTMDAEELSKLTVDLNLDDDKKMQVMQLLMDDDGNLLTGKNDEVSIDMVIMTLTKLNVTSLPPISQMKTGELEREFRHRYLMNVGQSFVSQYELGLLGRESMHILQQYTDKASLRSDPELLFNKIKGRLINAIQEQGKIAESVKASSKLYKDMGFMRKLYYTVDAFTCIQMGRGYVYACKSVKVGDVMKEGGGVSTGPWAMDVNRNSKRFLNVMQDLLEILCKENEQTACEVITREVVMRTLHHQRHKVHHMLEHGCLTKQEYKKLDAMVAETMLSATQNICFVCGTQPLEIAADLTTMTTMSSKSRVPDEYKKMNNNKPDVEMGDNKPQTV